MFARVGFLTAAEGGRRLASTETIAGRVAQIVEAYSGDGGRPRSAGVRHHKGRTSAMNCIGPRLRAAVAMKTGEELDLENLRGKIVLEWLRGGEGESTSAAKGGSRQKRWARGFGGSHVRFLKGGYGVELDQLFPLSLVNEVGRVRKSGGRCVPGYEKKRPEEDVNDLIAGLNWFSGPRALCALGSATTPLRDSTGQGASRSGTLDFRDPWRTQPGQFSISVENLVTVDDRVAPRGDGRHGVRRANTNTAWSAC